MRVLLYPALWLVSGLITLLAAIGIGFEWSASKLVPAQKFLSRVIEGSA